jgi:hypothetical protein
MAMADAAVLLLADLLVDSGNNTYGTAPETTPSATAATTALGAGIRSHTTPGIGCFELKEFQSDTSVS